MYGGVTGSKQGRLPPANMRKSSDYVVAPMIMLVCTVKKAQGQEGHHRTSIGMYGNETQKTFLQVTLLIFY